MRKRLAINHYSERSAEGLDEFMEYMKKRQRVKASEPELSVSAEALGVDVEDLETWGDWRPFHVSTTRCPESARVMSFDDSLLSGLSNEQRQAVFLVEAGISVFVTGPGGTGKSRIISILKNAGLRVKVTASTGIAARNVGGITLHRFAGLGLRAERFLSHIDRVPIEDKRIECWRNCDVLVIDEVSMIDPAFMAQLDVVARASRRKAPAIKPAITRRPFGGIQIVLLGDFAQLTTGTTIPLALLNYVPFVVELKSIFRQSDPRFRELLNNIRLGKRVRGDLFILSTRQCSRGDEDTNPAPQLSAFRKTCSSLNQKQMQNEMQVRECSPSQVRTFRMEVAVPEGGPELGWDSIRASLLADIGWESDSLTLCVGARVLLTKNLDQEKGLVNGSLGKIVAFDEQGLPNVEWDGEGLAVTTVPIVTQEIELSRCNVKMSYLPLLCAWAITVHRAQGMTLARARIHVKSMKTPALLYTALSRVASLQGLEIIGSVDEENIVANDQAVQFYKRLRELVEAQAAETDGLCVLPSHVLCD